MEEIMTRKMFALLVAGTVMVLQVTAAFASDSTVGLGSSQGGTSSARAWSDLHLPPVPYIETMPWLMDGSATQGPKFDMLWSPKLDTLGPFLIQPEIPSARFSLGSVSSIRG
jgi:hypothetical protein